MKEFPYEGQITSSPLSPLQTGVDLKGDPHTPPEKIDPTPQFQTPGTLGISLRRFVGPLLVSFIFEAIIITLNPFVGSGPNPFLSVVLSPYAAVVTQFILIFIGLLFLEFLFGLTGSPVFLWAAFTSVVLFFFWMMYFFDRNFFDPSYQVNLGPLPQLLETVKSYLASPF